MSINKCKTLNDVIVDRINKYLGERNLTQYKLAQLSNIPYETLKSIMQKRTNGITLKTILMISYGLNISASEFLDDPNFDL